MEDVEAGCSLVTLGMRKQLTGRGGGVARRVSVEGKGGGQLNRARVNGHSSARHSDNRTLGVKRMVPSRHHLLPCVDGPFTPSRREAGRRCPRTTEMPGMRALR